MPHDDLEAARAAVERALGIRMKSCESYHWGEYYWFRTEHERLWLVRDEESLAVEEGEEDPRLERGVPRKWVLLYYSNEGDLGRVREGGAAEGGDPGASVDRAVRVSVRGGGPVTGSGRATGGGPPAGGGAGGDPAAPIGLRLVSAARSAGRYIAWISLTPGLRHPRRLSEHLSNDDLNRVLLSVLNAHARRWGRFFRRRKDPAE